MDKDAHNSHTIFEIEHQILADHCLFVHWISFLHWIYLDNHLQPSNSASSITVNFLIYIDIEIQLHAF